jgi:hypothetical protein
VALQTKVGVNSSAVETSLDYLVKNTSSESPGHKHALDGDFIDVDLDGKLDGDLLAYNATSEKWEPNTSDTPDASTTLLGKVKVSTTPSGDPTAVETGDPRVPSQDENDALAGTSGTPSGTNKYVTNDDVAEAKTASKIARRDSNSDILVATTPTNADAATSKTYVDARTGHTSGVASYALTTASGNQTIAHGLGKTPNFVVLRGVVRDTSAVLGESYGTYSASGNANVASLTGASGTAEVSGSHAIRIYQGSTSAYQTGTVTVDATNITIAWVKTGSPTGTAQILWEAHG